MEQETPAAPLDDAALGTLAAVLDTLLPPNPRGDLPGAGGLGLAAPVAAAVAATPALFGMLAAGLGELEAAARARHGEPFAALPYAERAALLGEQAFVLPLTLSAYMVYYRHPRVLAGLGLEPRPPHPQGYEIEPGDLSLLDPVRARPPFWRPC